MRKQIVDIYNGDKKVCSTTVKEEIAYYKKLGYSIIKTGSFIIRK